MPKISRNNKKIIHNTIVAGGYKSTLGELNDVDISGITDGQVIKYNEAQKKFIPASGAGAIDEFIKLNDTPSSYTGQANKGIKVKNNETGLEFYNITDSDEKVKADNGDNTAGYLSDKVDGNTLEVDTSNHKIKVKDGVFAPTTHNHDGRYYTKTETDNLLSDKEDNSNKVSSWQSTPDNTHYPTEKLVKDNLDDLQTQIDNNTSDISNLQTNKANDNEVVHLVGTETITGRKTFNNDVDVNGNINIDGNVNIKGNLNYVDTQNLQVEDKVIILDKGGTNADGSGLEVEENGSIVASLKYNKGDDRWNDGTDNLARVGEITNLNNNKANKDLSNVSNTDFLNKIKAVDGSGSGVDADLLDGHNSDYFAIDNEVVHRTGDETIDGVKQFIDRLEIVRADSDYKVMRFRNNNENSAWDISMRIDKSFEIRNTTDITSGHWDMRFHINLNDGNIGIGPNVTSPASLVSIGNNGELGTFSVQDIDGNGNIATFRDVDGENVFKTQGKLSDESFVCSLGDYDGAYDEESFSFEKGKGIKYKDESGDLFSVDRDGNANIKKKLTVTQIALRDNNDSSGTANSFIYERENSTARRILFKGNPQAGSFGFVVAPTGTSTSNVNFGIWNTDFDNGGSGSYAGMQLTDTGTLEIYTNGQNNKIIFSPNNIDFLICDAGTNQQKIKFLKPPAYQAITTVSSNVTLGIENHIVLVDTINNNITISLPSNPIDGQEIIVKDAKGSTGGFMGPTITIDGNGKDIDGQQSTDISTAYGKVRLIWVEDLDQWQVL